MAQFYFLSVLFNILSGLILVYGRDLTLENDSSLVEDNEDFDATSQKSEMPIFNDFNGFNNATFRLVVGIISVFVGIMKLLSSFDGIPLAGDLFAALAGIASGIALLIEFYLVNASDPDIVPEGIQTIFIDSRKYIGVVCLVVGLLHFIFPQALFL